jgi:hypothetical protein
VRRDQQLLTEKREGMPHPEPVRREHARPGDRWFAVRMHELNADLAALQDLLDSSYATAGQHLLSIHTSIVSALLLLE